MDEKKFGNVLTFILIVLIVIIGGILAYFGYSAVTSSRTKANSDNALQDFEQTVAATPVPKKNDTSDTADTAASDTTSEEPITINNPLDKLRASENDNTGSGGSSSAAPAETKKTYMENYEVIGTIKIPKIKLEYPVLEKVTKRALELSICKFDGPGLNEVGNTTLMGHNYRNGLFFSNNKKLSEGDEVYITDKTGTTITYVIYNMYYTDPNDANYMRRDTEGKREISLSTCNDDSSERLVIWAKEK